MTATSLDLSQIKTDALSSAATFRTLIGLGTLATQSPTGTPSASNFLRGDYSWQTIDLSGYVPYTGANANLNLGSYTLTAKSATLSTGTITASAPAVDISQTWNSSGVTFTGSKINITDTASASGSLLADWQVGGVSKFKADKNGGITAAGFSTVAQTGASGTSIEASGRVTTTFNGALTSVGQRWVGTDGVTYWVAGGDFQSGNSAVVLNATGAGSGQGRVNLGGGYLYLDGGPTFAGIKTYASLLLSPGSLGSTGAVEQRNSTTAQTYRLYGTYTDASNYERLALSSTTYSSAKYQTIAAESAGTGAANINMVVSPKGTGAFMLQTPDGTATGGNARGINAVDLSTDRSGNTFVASGSGSVISGGSNNKATAVNSVVAGGNSNAATGQYSTVGGGIYNTSSGVASYTAGYANQATNTCSVGFGFQTLANRYNQFAIGCPQFSSAGDAQWCLFTLRIKTTDATATTLMLDGSTTRLTIPSGKVFAFIAKISGIKSDGSAVAFYTRKGCIKNVGGATSLVGSIETIGTDTEDNAATDVAITADDTNDALQINVTGIAAETWRWVAVVEGIEIGYGT